MLFPNDSGIVCPHCKETPLEFEKVQLNISCGECKRTILTLPIEEDPIGPGDVSNIHKTHERRNRK